MNAKTMAALIAALMLVTVPAWADWDEGDPFKMHYPQLPDPNGWDVTFMHGMLGDDWRCTETGPVSDIHMWVSFKNDDVPFAPAAVSGFVEIWSDHPQGVGGANFSHPREPLWHMDVNTNMPNVNMRLYENGDQRWLDPVADPNDMIDHHETYQINIDPIDDPFIQQKDTIYWLVSHLFVEDVSGPANERIGWKTSKSDQFLDDGVWEVPGVGPPWSPLEDPFTGLSLDLAFVITVPEPGVIVLLILGLAGLLAVRRNR